MSGDQLGVAPSNRARSNRRLPESLRVLVVSTSLEPSANTLWSAAGALVSDLMVAGGASMNLGARDDPGRVIALPEIDIAGRGLIWRHLRGLRRTIRDFEPDIVHVNGELWSWTVQQVLGIGRPVVAHGAENVWAHGNVVEQRAREILIRRALRMSSGYASWNEPGRDYIQHLAGPDFPTLVLPAIIPPDAYRRVTWCPPAHDTDAFEVLLVGRLVPLKGFDTIIRAVARSRYRHLLRLRVCGEGPERSGLEELARQLHVAIEMMGHVSPDDLAELMRRATMLVQPSKPTSGWIEQFGRSVAEAMTVGLPCLVSDTGELPVLVDHDPDAIFPQGDDHALSLRLDKYVEASDELIALSARQRRSSSRYDPSRASDQLVAFWTRAVQSTAV